MFKYLYTGFNAFDKKSSRIDFDDYVGKAATAEPLDQTVRSGALDKRREACV